MAIQVNGTEVISNSRALNNIASVDATTVAAMSAAGVGGLTTLIAENASMGSGAQLKLSLGNYDEQTFLINNLQKTAASANIGRAGLGLTNSSGNLETGQVYTGIEMRRLVTEYQSSPLGTGTAYYNDYALYVYTDRYPNDGTGSYAGRIDGMVRVRHAKSTTRPTELFARFHASYPNNGGESWSSSLTYKLINPSLTNNHIVFYFQASGSAFASSGTYTSWGVN